MEDRYYQYISYEIYKLYSVFTADRFMYNNFRQMDSKMMKMKLGTELRKIYF